MAAVIFLLAIGIAILFFYYLPLTPSSLIGHIVRALSYLILSSLSSLIFQTLLWVFADNQQKSVIDLIELSDHKSYKTIRLQWFILSLKNETEDEKRVESAKALGNIGDIRAVEPLIIALKDKSSKVRKAVANALGTIGDTSALEPLLLLSIKDSDSDVREVVAKALEKIDPNWSKSKAVQKVFPQIISFLKDKTFIVREESAKALGIIGDIRAVEPLIIALKDKSSKVRKAISWSPITDKLIFSAGELGYLDIYTISLDGSNLKRLTNIDGNDYECKFSSNGAKIVFTSYRNGNQDIYIMNYDGSNQTQLTKSTNYESHPLFCPN